MSSKRARRRRNSNRIWWIGGGVLVALLVVAIVALNTSNSNAATALLATPPAPAPMDVCGSATCGQANAPVTLDVYADFQCPYCAAFEPTLQQLKARYIDTGKVKVIYHNFPFIGAESNSAAQAAECAGDQNHFWLFAHDLFAHQGNENSGVFTAANLKKMAAGLGLDQAAFNACLDSGKHSAAVNAEYGQGQQQGIQSTPTFFVNGQKHEGGMAFDQLSALIDTTLAR